MCLLGRMRKTYRSVHSYVKGSEMSGLPFMNRELFLEALSVTFTRSFKPLLNFLMDVVCLTLDSKGQHEIMHSLLTLVDGDREHTRL